MRFEKRSTREDAIKVEQRFRGLSCNRFEICTDGCPESDHIQLSVSGSRESFIASGLITQTMIDMLPKSGTKHFPPGQHGFSGRPEETAEIKRGKLTRSAHGFRFEKYIHERDNVLAFLREIGVDDFEFPDPVAFHKKVDGFHKQTSPLDIRSGYAVGMLGAQDYVKRSRCVGRFQRPATWTCIEKLIIIDWGLVKRTAAVSH